MYGRGPTNLNFPEDAKHAGFLASTYRMYSHKKEKAHDMSRMDEVAMAKYVKANLHLMAAELEFWANKQKEQRMKEDAEMDALIPRGLTRPLMSSMGRVTLSMMMRRSCS